MTTLRDGATEIVRRLQEKGFQAFWVGGCVRDFEMGREARDYDIATDALPEQVVRIFPDSLPVGAHFGVILVLLRSRKYEVSTFRAEGPYLDGRRPSHVEFVNAETDVRRRDFTINGLLYDPTRGQLIDLVEGKKDIERKRIRTIGPARDRFAEDKLRMLRAVRLSAELEFEIEKETREGIRHCASGIREVSGERIRDEFLRLITAPGRGQGMRTLLWSGLLAGFLPELVATCGVCQPREFHPEGDVFTHTVLTLERLTQPGPELALAALLHDIGKPPTFVEADRIRFHGHDVVGVQMADEICRRLKLSNHQRQRVMSLVGEHMRIRQLPNMRVAKARRFLARDDLSDHLSLHRADCLASHGDLSVCEWAEERLRSLSQEPLRPPPLVTGRHLLEIGYEPGPRMGAMLEWAFDAQLEGTVSTLEQALASIRLRFPLPDKDA